MSNLVVENNEVCFTVERKIYPMEVIFGACYNFIDRCYVFLDKGDKDTVRVSLKGKEKLADGDLEAIAGEFQNELLTQSLRKKINKQNKKIREYIVSRALYSVEPYEEME
ncbi:MAG: His-Xaa-Ser system protein HxsD, partial [bacterium]